jgi:hypothetical protein
VVPKVSLPKDDPNVETGEEGFTIIIDGYLQGKQVKCLYHKNSDPLCMQFCTATDPINHVFDYEVEDTPMMQEGNDGNMYQIKILVKTLDGDEPATQETLEDFATGTFVPALMRQKGVFKNARPIMHPTEPYVQVAAWNKILGNTSGLSQLFTYAFKQGSESFGAWMKADHANLYSMFPIGEVPDFIKTNYVLTSEHLLAPDIAQAVPVQAEANQEAVPPADDVNDDDNAGDDLVDTDQEDN